jgi:hypothetical protein
MGEPSPKTRFDASHSARMWSHRLEPVSDRCRCLLSFDPPSDQPWWLPTVDLEPGPDVQAVAIVGDDPRMRRVVRVPGGWEPVGIMVDFYEELTEPMAWHAVGLCSFHKPHPVIAVTPMSYGLWGGDR